MIFEQKLVVLMSNMKYGGVANIICSDGGGTGTSTAADYFISKQVKICSEVQ